MYYDTYYQIKLKLDSVYEKINNLKSFGFDNTSLIKEFNRLNDSLDELDSTNYMGNTAFRKIDAKKIKSVLVLVTDFDNFLDEFTTYFRIINDINNLDNMDLNTKVSLLLNDLLDYKKVFKYTQKDTLDYTKIYEVIKEEFLQNTSSLLYSTMKKLNIGISSIDKLIQSDIDKYQIQKDTDNKEELILLIALKENNKIDEIAKRIKDLQKELSEIDTKKETLTHVESQNEEEKTKYRKSYRKLIKKIMPLILSISMLTSAHALLAKHEKKLSQNFLATTQYYDTYNNKVLDDVTFTRLNENDAIITIYYPKQELKKRYIEKYVIRDFDGDIRSLRDYDLSNAELIFNDFVSERDLEQVTNSEYESFEIIKSIDYSKNELGNYPVVFDHFAISLLCILLDLLLSTMALFRFDSEYFVSFGTLLFDYKHIMKLIKSSIDEIEDNRKKMLEKDALLKYTKEYKELNIKYNEVLSKYNELINKYSLLEEEFNEKGISFKLKKEK